MHKSWNCLGVKAPRLFKSSHYLSYCREHKAFVMPEEELHLQLRQQQFLQRRCMCQSRGQEKCNIYKLNTLSGFTEGIGSRTSEVQSEDKGPWARKAGRVAKCLKGYVSSEMSTKNALVVLTVDVNVWQGSILNYNLSLIGYRCPDLSLCTYA